MTHTLTIGAHKFEIASAATPVARGDDWIVSGQTVRVSVPFDANRFYRQGWHSWSLTRWEDLAEAPVRLPADWGGFGADNVAILGPEHRSSWVGAVSVGEGPALVVGALGFDAHVTGSEQSLIGESINGPVDWFVGFGEVEQVLERYATALGDRLGNVRNDPGRVWCSWYAYYEDIDEAQMIEVLGGLEGLGFDVVQIDDGWQVEVGDWMVNDDFPNGMESMARRIADAGHRPGLWIAPFIAHERSRTFEEHPEWFVSSDGGPVVAGHNWGGDYYGLDMTHPEAMAHVRAVIEQAVAWGYTYLKLDFLFAAGVPGDRHDPAPTGEEAYRAGVELIRDAAGEDTYLLACGSLIVPSIGVFDAMRVGQDVSSHWENRAGGIEFYSAVSTRFAISNSLSRLWLSPVVAVDPDVVYFRSENLEMTSAQTQQLLDIASICGFVATSDPPHWMSDDERQAMRSFMRGSPRVDRLGRYEFRIDGREVSFRDASLDV